MTLVSSRTTAFDKISHQLHAALLDIAPCYDRLHQPKKYFAGSRYCLPLMPAFLGTKKASLIKAFGMTPIMTHSTTPITVFSCDAELDSTAYDFAYTTKMDDIGLLKVGISSQQVCTQVSRVLA